MTNHFPFAASTIAAIYRQRRQIELFFKALKQYLKIKTFMGTRANAVHIQVWTAWIAILLLPILDSNGAVYKSQKTIFTLKAS